MVYAEKRQVGGAIKVFYKRNAANVNFFFICSATYAALYCTDSIKLDFNDDVKFNLVTISTVFAGFMYTILSNMMEFNSRKSIKTLDKVGHVDKYYLSSNIGLYSFVLSILVGLAELVLKIPTNYTNLIDGAMLYFMFIGVVFFMLSSYNMNNLIRIVRSDDE